MHSSRPRETGPRAGGPSEMRRAECSASVSSAVRASDRAGEEVRCLPAERLIVVANSLPLRMRRAGDGWHATPSPGGLVAALAPIAADLEAKWIGWAGGL